MNEIARLVQMYKQLPTCKQWAVLEDMDARLRFMEQLSEAAGHQLSPKTDGTISRTVLGAFCYAMKAGQE